MSRRAVKDKVKVLELLQKHSLALQRLRDLARSSAKTVKATAKALAAANKERRDANEQKWSPFQRLVGAVAALATLASLYLAWQRHG